MNPYIARATPLEDHRLQLAFENGEERIFDLKPYLTRGVFRRLVNPSLFRRVRVVSGSVEWPGEIDLSYDTLYLESQPIEGGGILEGAANSPDQSFRL